MKARPRVKTKYPGVYYRERANGSIQYIIWFTGSDGKGRFQNVPGGLKDAVKARARIVDRIAHGHRVAPTRVTFSEFARTWLAEQEGSANTIATYTYAVEKHLIPKLGARTRLSELDVNRVALLIGEMRREGKKAWTIRTVLTPLSRIMSAAVRRGLAPVNPVSQLERSEMPRSDQAAMNILDTDEIRLFLDASPALYRALFATAVFTGLRISELLALRWEDVDWDEGLLRVAGTKSKSAEREVVLMPALQQILAAHSLEHEGSTFLFERTDGSPMLRGTVSRACKETMLKAGIRKRVRFHDLRHTFASILISHGYDDAFIAEQMGHSSSLITRKTYGHLFDRKKKYAEHRERMEAAFGEVLG